VNVQFSTVPPRGQPRSTKVLVVGLGPCGVTVANHLGLYGIETVVIDRAADILDYPRAVGMDDEALRSFQTVGLAEALLDDMVRNVPARYHTSKGKCFAHVHPQGQPYGWSRRNLFLQPLMEATLRRGLSRFACVTTLLGHELEGLVEREGGITATIRPPDGASFALRADYVVGADGGRSTVRNLIGAKLEGKTDSARWLVVDMQDDELDAPFTSVYTHINLPKISIALPYGHRRFEFRIPSGESEEEVLQPERLEARIGQFYPPGPRRARVLRARVYTHHSRIADRFRVGRVFLAGDSAHLQPPFFGQGMNSGLRDATNLAWKLAAVLTGRAGDALLDSYEAERRDHARKMVNIATMMGRLYAPGSRVAEFARDTLFRLIQGLPNLRDYILQMRFKPMPRYTQGVVLHRVGIAKDSPVGRMFMQPMVETADRRKLKLDDAIGPWFAVIGANKDPARFLNDQERTFWTASGASLVHMRRSRSAPDTVPSAEGTIVLDDLMGGFRDWRMQNPGKDFIILRPDRYVAAVCSADELNLVSAEMRHLMGAAVSLCDPGRARVGATALEGAA
jgi:3-(3-hydroxy-phenyl)propionate hydroxylase